MKRPAEAQPSVLTIIAYKYPDRPHYEWTGNMLIKTDDYVLVHGQAGRRLVHHTRGQTFTYATQSLEFYPLNAPFTVNIDFDAHGASYHCNVCLPPRLDGDTLSFRPRPRLCPQSSRYLAGRRPRRVPRQSTDVRLSCPTD